TEHHQRVAIRRRRGEDLEGDLAARTRTIVDHKALAQGIAELLCKAARDGIHAAAGRERYKHTHRPTGIILRMRREMRERCKEQQAPYHAVFHRRCSRTTGRDFDFYLPSAFNISNACCNTFSMRA